MLASWRLLGLNRASAAFKAVASAKVGSQQAGCYTVWRATVQWGTYLAAMTLLLMTL